MSKLIDLTGQRFNRLTVLRRDSSRKDRTYWICQCDCGNIVSIEGYNLRKGKTQSCGCLQKERVSQQKTIDLIGQKFGYLTVLKKDTSKTKKGAYWICQCDCGNIVSISGPNLRSGNTKSCGCLNKEINSKQKLIDLTDQKFSHLTVIKKDTSKIGKYIYWMCRCDCGNIVSIRGDALKNGNTQSCGCIKSKGEDKIRKTLFSLKINFIQQKTFDDLKYKSNLKFDFFLPEYKCCIEYQGEQHYKEIKLFGGEEYFRENQIRDNIKKEWCKKNNIKLIEIPYWDFDKINVDYIKSKL